MDDLTLQQLTLLNVAAGDCYRPLNELRMRMERTLPADHPAIVRVRAALAAIGETSKWALDRMTEQRPVMVYGPAKFGVHKCDRGSSDEASRTRQAEIDHFDAARQVEREAAQARWLALVWRVNNYAGVRRRPSPGPSPAAAKG